MLIVSHRWRDSLERLWHIYCTDFGISLLSRVEWFLFLKWFATPSVTWCVKSQGFGSSTSAATMPYSTYLTASSYFQCMLCSSWHKITRPLPTQRDIQSICWLRLALDATGATFACGWPQWIQLAAPTYLLTNASRWFSFVSSVYTCL